MGTYNKGILGPFSGKVGTVVGANWRGKDVMRSLPKKTNRTPTETQLLQRQLFTTVAEFLTPMSNVVSLYFGQRGGFVSRRNQAMSYHMREAVEYVDPNFDILYNKVLIAKGDLVGVQNPAVTPRATHQIEYTWENNSGQGSAKPTDQLVVVVYAPEENLYYTLLNAAQRDGASVTINLPAFFSGLEVQSWITFASETGKSYATSVYMGAVTVT
jgi:FlaG/FlaF family flagellin (archaellin)